MFEIDNTYSLFCIFTDCITLYYSGTNNRTIQRQARHKSSKNVQTVLKGYTLTEYLNDVNQENTEIPAEYDADDTLRQAYTYGETGAGERIAVDKSVGSSYYLYDRRGILMNERENC